jgi:surface antigen
MRDRPLEGATGARQSDGRVRPIRNRAYAALLFATLGGVALSVSGVAAVPAQAETRSVTVEFATIGLSPQDRAEVAVRVAPPAACSLTVGRRGPLRVTSRVVTHLPVVEWSWKVGPRVKPGRRPVKVACASSRKLLSKGRQVGSTNIGIVVKGKRGRRGSSSLVRPGTLKVKLRRKAGNNVPRVPRNGHVIDGRGAAGNRFSECECTWLAYERRSDIYEAAVRAGVPARGVWDAWRWADNAQRGGIPVGGHPSAGAIVVFPRSPNYGEVGHVGYVTSVNRDGSFNTEERGIPDIRGQRGCAPGRGRTKSFTRRSIPGTRFIYGGPARTPNSNSPSTLPTFAATGYQIAFNGADGKLWSVGSADSRALPYGVKAGTSPAITGLSGGGYQIAFHAADGKLWSVGSVESRALPYGMKTGTSPAITGLAGGGYQVAFNGADGKLWSVGSADSRALPYGVKAGTSPAITGLSGGGYQIAFHAADGNLWSVGSAESRALPYGVKTGTSPAITSRAGGGYQIAFQGADGNLWTVGSADSRALPYGVKAGTSPAITGLSGGGYQIAFHAADGKLWLVGSAESRALPYGVKTGTSPAITSRAGGGYQIAFQGADGNLWTVGSAESRALPYGIKAETSPAIAGLVLP